MNTQAKGKIESNTRNSDVEKLFPAVPRQIMNMKSWKRSIHHQYGKSIIKNISMNIASHQTERIQNKAFLKNDAKSGQNENIYLKQLIDYAV